MWGILYISNHLIFYMNIHQHPKDPASTWTDNINEHAREGELHGSTYMGVRTDRCGWWAGFPRGDQKNKIK